MIQIPNDIKEYLDKHPKIAKYRKLSVSGKTDYYIERDDKGVWHDKTAVEKAKERLADINAAIAAEQAKEARRRWNRLPKNIQGE